MDKSFDLVLEKNFNLAVHNSLNNARTKFLVVYKVANLKGVLNAIGKRLARGLAKLFCPQFIHRHGL